MSDETATRTLMYMMPWMLSNPWLHGNRRTKIFFVASSRRDATLMFHKHNQKSYANEASTPPRLEGEGEPSTPRPPHLSLNQVLAVEVPVRPHRLVQVLLLLELVLALRDFLLQIDDGHLAQLHLLQRLRATPAAPALVKILAASVLVRPFLVSRVHSEQLKCWPEEASCELLLQGPVAQQIAPNRC